MGWNYSSIPKLQRLDRWSLRMNKWFHLTLYNGGKSENFICGRYRCIFFIIWWMILQLGQNLKLCPHSNIIRQMICFLNFICFHVLHNVWHKISTIFMMLKAFSCADLFSRPLCWSIYWWIMWFLCGFENIAKNHHRVYITTVTGICVGSQGNVRNKSGIFFSANPVATLHLCDG